MRHPSRFHIASVVVLSLSCGDPASPSAQITTYTVRPSATNPAITQWDADHHVWVRPREHDGNRVLLLLLAGTGGAPRNAREIGALAAAEGYDVIGLMYANDRAVVAECAGDPDPACMGSMRAEIIEGADHSPHVTVDGANSIEGRLTALLAYLAREHAGQGWDAYLDGGAPRWASIAVGGLSQGGGHAAYIAKLWLVPRVLMFGAPADGVAGSVAPWIGPGATPPSSYYGLAHVRDPFASIGPNWLALGLDEFGQVVQVEHSAPPYAGSHMLRTDLPPATGSYAAAHSSVFADGSTARNADGLPALAPVWRYMIGRP